MSACAGIGTPGMRIYSVPVGRCAAVVGTANRWVASVALWIVNRVQGTVFALFIVDEVAEITVVLRLTLTSQLRFQVVIEKTVFSCCTYIKGESA